MQRYPLLILLILTLTLTSCTYEQGSGILSNKTYDVDEFTKIHLQWRGNILFAEGEQQVTVIAEDNVLERLQLTTTDDTLTIQKDDHTTFLRPTKTITYKITTPVIEEVKITGAGNFEAKKITAEEFTIDIAGAGDVTIQELITTNFLAQITGAGDLKTKLKAKNAAITVSGAGNTKLTGTTNTLDYKVSGAGDLDAEFLQSNYATIIIAGAGDARVQAKDRLYITISGAGNVYYTGAAQLATEITGFGDIKKIS